MIKLFQQSKKIGLFALVVLLGLTINVPFAEAQVCSVGQPANISKTSGTLVGDVGTLAATIKKTQFQLTNRLGNMKRDVTKAINGVSQSVTAAATTLMTTDQKLADVVLTQELEQEKRLRQAEAAVNGQPSAADCIQATGKQHAPEGETVSKATGQALAGEFANIYTGVGGGLSVSDEDNSVAYQADLFRYIMANFCNPETNGGLMPTQANPIQTTSGPLWCGMDRGGDAELTDLHLKMPGLLLGPSKIIDHPKARSGVMVSMLMMLGLPMDKTSLPSLETAAGQRAYVEKMAQGTRMMLPATYISEKFGERFPSVNNTASAWARGIFMANLGENPPSELADFINQKYAGNISQSQFVEAMVAQYTGPQYINNTAGLSDGQYDRQVINLVGMLNYLKNKRLKESEATNAFSAAMYASGIR